MALTLTIWWFTGVVGGIALFTGVASIIWAWRTNHKDRLIFGFLGILIGFLAMSNSLFSILRLIRSCA